MIKRKKWEHVPQRDLFVASNGERWRLAPARECPSCGERFRPKATLVKLGGGKFCSTGCSNRYHAKEKTRLFPKRFWKLLLRKSTGCWEWPTCISPNGYGYSYLNGVKTATHRIAYILNYGSIPIGMWVLHKCDNRRCANPDHLFLGTPQDNVNDMIAKDRGSRGEKRKAAKLTDKIVIQIRQSEKSAYWWAKRLGFSQGSIADAKFGRSWKHIQ